MLSPARARAALFALALGGFCIGTTEFATMGMLPEIATDLGAPIPTAGHAITAYALGVVVGAPTIAVLGARMDRRRLLLLLMSAFVVGNVLSAFAPDDGMAGRVPVPRGAAARHLLRRRRRDGRRGRRHRAPRPGGRRDDGRPDDRLRGRRPADVGRRRHRRLALVVHRGRGARARDPGRALGLDAVACPSPRAPPCGRRSRRCATGDCGSRSVPARSASAACSPSTPTSSRCSPR